MHDAVLWDARFSAHWTLAVVCNPVPTTKGTNQSGSQSNSQSNSQSDSEPPRRILIFDSLGTRHAKLNNQLTKYVGYGASPSPPPSPGGTDARLEQISSARMACQNWQGGSLPILHLLSQRTSWWCTTDDRSAPCDVLY